MIPRYLYRRTAAKDLEQLLRVHLLQLRAEMQLEEAHAETQDLALQQTVLELWREKARFEVQLLDRILQPTL